MKQSETQPSRTETVTEQLVATLVDVADIFDGYRPVQAWDEMFAAPGKPRAAYDALVSVLQPMDPAELRYRADQLAHTFTERGVTYDYAGEERAMPVDLIPRVIDPNEWDRHSKRVVSGFGWTIWTFI